MTFGTSMERELWRARGLHRHRRLIDKADRFPVGRLIAGMVIAVLGLGLLLDNLGLGETGDYFRRSWPAIMVIVGIALLIRRDPSRNRYAFWGTLWLFAGCWVYATQQHWIPASLHDVFIPAILVGAGASFIYRGLRRRS